MLKVLLKKQLGEVFKSYFYDAKKNKMRSKWAIAGWFVFFFVIMVGFLGGVFTFLSLTLCEPLSAIGMGWLYFLIMSGIAVLLGAFGSVFNTYSGLYLGKDNDLLLSMPIPVRTIIAARLTNVYLMGTMYAATVFLPALIVYWVVIGLTAARVICGIILFLIITVIVLLLSCLLGWVVAKISLKLKNKSFITVLVSLLFIGTYYFFYFRANDLIKDIILNAEIYGEKIRGTSQALYLFGRIGEGDWKAAAVFSLATAIVSALVWIVMSRSFLGIVTSGGSTAKVRYVEKPAKERSVFRALISKEFAKFTSNANYMLNCGLGVLLIPATGVLLLVKGRDILDVFDITFSSRPDCTAILVCTALCMLTAMNDMSAPSVSLEGKSLWIPQSLPVEPQMVLHAKASVQMLLTVIPMLFASLCAVLVIRTSLPVKLLMFLMPLIYAAFSSIFDTVIGLKMPILNWTDEIAPIKQSGAVMIALFGSWAFCIIFAGLYMLVGYKIGAMVYLLSWTVLFAAVGLGLLRWMDTKGAAVFAEL